MDDKQNVDELNEQLKKCCLIRGTSIFSNNDIDWTLTVMSNKLAQLVIAPVPMIGAYEIDELPITERGANGLGSTRY